MNEQNSYYAFISYNSADEKWAKWLQHNLEYYHMPNALYKEYPELPKKIRPVFWYKQDLSGTKLKKALNNELSLSKYLIVICSPDSAKAEWVNDEVVALIESSHLLLLDIPTQKIPMKNVSLLHYSILPEMKKYEV